MIIALAMVLATPQYFLRTQAEGWTVAKDGLSCSAEKQMGQYKKIRILKSKDPTATFFLTATENGGEYFGEKKVTEPVNLFEVYLKTGVKRTLLSESQKATAMAFEGRVSIMTTFDYNKLISSVPGKESIVFRKDDIHFVSFLIEGLPTALSLLDKCSKTLRG